MPAFSLRAKALDDLDGIVRYIGADNPAAASKFRAEVYKRFDLLARHPRMAPERPHLASDVRLFPYGKYLICYLPAEDGITVLRVLHGARNITPDMFRNG